MLAGLIFVYVRRALHSDHMRGHGFDYHSTSLCMTV